MSSIPKVHAYKIHSISSMWRIIGNSCVFHFDRTLPILHVHDMNPYSWFEAIIPCLYLEYEICTLDFDQGIFLRKIYINQSTSASFLRKPVHAFELVLSPWDTMSRYLFMHILIFQIGAHMNFWWIFEVSLSRFLFLPKLFCPNFRIIDSGHFSWPKWAPTYWKWYLVEISF